MLKVIKTLVSKNRSAQSTSQINSLSGKVIKSEKFLEQITGARGGGGLYPNPVKKDETNN